MIDMVLLEERVAKLIAPDVIWDQPDDMETDEWYAWFRGSWQRTSARGTARRVIEGLGLDAENTVLTTEVEA